MVEVADGKVPLHQEHVLEERAAGVGAVGHSFIQGPICHIPKKDHGLLHDGQGLLGPQVGLLKVTWNTNGNLKTPHQSLVLLLKCLLLICKVCFNQFVSSLRICLISVFCKSYTVTERIYKIRQLQRLIVVMVCIKSALNQTIRLNRNCVMFKNPVPINVRTL